MRKLRPAVALLVALAVVPWAGCAAHRAYRSGQSEAKKGNWDLAVARLTKALAESPDNITYKIALENARIQASRYHVDLARKQREAQDLDKAAEELQIAVNYDPANKSASDDLAIVREKIRQREEERARRSDFDALKERAGAARVPVPVLSPRSQAPISLKFADQSLQKILESLGKLAGVNVIFDGDYRDKRTSVDLSGVTFEEALNQITFTNRLFYKVLDQNTVVVAAESPAKRKTYDENLVRTFYLQNAEVNETLQLIKSLAGLQKAGGNPSLGAITVMGTVDELALAERIIEANDKARGEVVVEVNILEVNRTQLKNYGIELSNYAAGVTFAPTGAEGETADGITSVRAHLLSSLNLSDWVVSIPSSLFLRFLQTESTVKIIASPKLRAAEGKKTSLKIGTEVPIPVTTFTASAQGGNQTFVPATSFQYRNVGVNLELTPRVNASGDVLLELQAEFSLLGDDRNVGSTSNPLIVPTFLTRNVTGILRLHDGETSLIGGLVQGRNSDAFRGVAGLQSIPVLNRLFTSRTDNDDEGEVIISITPRLVRGPKIVEGDLQPLLVGTKEVVRVPSARASMFGEPEAEPSPSAAPPATAPAVGTPAPAPGPVAPAADAEEDEGGEPEEDTPSAPVPVPTPLPTPQTLRPPAPAQARALWSPGEVRVKAGEIATVSLVIVGGRDLGGVEARLVHDAGALQVVEANPGTLLTLDGQGVGAERQIENGRTRVRFTRAQPATGSGAVVVLKLKALQAGTATLALESLSLPGSPAAPAAPAPARIVVEP
jgi:general secretion pathway protein D